MSVQTPPQPGTDHAAGGTPEMFGPYRLERTIGRGGMGEVFRAYDTGRQRTVAVKRLHGGLAEDAEYQERFRRESRLAARLSSPHVIPIHDFGTIDGSLYIDMRLVSGQDLADEIERAGRLEPRRAALIVRQLADALDAAHEDGLVHRDVKPSNVLLTQHRGRDFVYLVDFGIVRTMGEGGGGGGGGGALTGTGLAIGTLSYMAPELFTGRHVDRGVDVYAVGCLLFEALTGRPPFGGEGPALMYEHLDAPPPRASEVVPGLPPAIDAVIATAMAKVPEQRWATAGDLADAAVAALAGPADSAPSTSGPVDATVVQGPAPRYDTPATSGPQPGAPPAGHRAYGPVTAAPPAWAPGPPAHTPGYAPPPFPPTGTGFAPPAGPPPRRSRTALWVSLAVVATLVVVVGLLAVVGLASDPAPAAPAAAPAAAAPAAAPAPANSAPANSAPASTAPTGDLAAAFPDITTLGANCAPYQPGAGEYTTSTGVRPVAVVRCHYGATVPDAYVYYVQWPTAADAVQWHDDQLAQGESLDDITRWGQNEGQTQGPLHTRNAGDGTVYATAAYENRPYSFDVVTGTLDESNRIFAALRLLPAASVPA